MKLIHINTWFPCMDPATSRVPSIMYLRNVPDFVERLNTRDDFMRAYNYGMRQIPFWVVVDDNDNVVDTSVEIDIDKVVAWYKEKYAA